MPTSYDFGAKTLESLKAELEPLAEQAVAQGRTYSIHISRAGADGYRALMTVFDKPAAPEVDSV